MAISMEPIGSIPRPAELLATMAAHAQGDGIKDGDLAASQEQVVRDTIERLQALGSPVARRLPARPGRSAGHPRQLRIFPGRR